VAQEVRVLALSSNSSTAKKKKKEKRKIIKTRCWWLMPVILAIWEAEIGRIMV
jgi:hypothetical protein